MGHVNRGGEMKTSSLIFFWRGKKGMFVILAAEVRRRKGDGRESGQGKRGRRPAPGTRAQAWWRWVEGTGEPGYPSRIGGKCNPPTALLGFLAVETTHVNIREE